MTKEFFNIKYEFDRAEVWRRIDSQLISETAGYICVADGNILQMVHNDPAYREVVNGSMFSICDSIWAPLFIKRIYGEQYGQYCGSDIFADAVAKRHYRQYFLGSSDDVLVALKENLSKQDPAIGQMTFESLPFRKVEEFDYPAIAERINADGADVIWVALGAPKQERFMNLLQPYLTRGVMIGVGAVFNFFCGLENAPSRAPKWMIKLHLEWLDRLFKEPRKQLHRCRDIVRTFPAIYRKEKRKSK